MKKVLMPFILMGIVMSSGPLEAVSTFRAMKCSMSRFHKKFNCTQAEKAAGKKWLKGVSIGAAVTALTAALAAVGITIGVQEVRKEKQRAEEEAYRQQPESRECTAMSIKDTQIKQILGLNPKNECFVWYEVFGFSAPVSRAEGLKKYRSLSLKNHPDKHLNEPIYVEVMKVINSAKDEMNK